MSNFKKKTDKDFEISGPIQGTFQHINKGQGTLNKNSVASSSTPSLSTSNLTNSTSSENLSSNLISPRSGMSNSTSPRNATTTTNTNNISIVNTKSTTVVSNTKPTISGTLQTQPQSATSITSSSILSNSNSANAKKTTKSTIISGKLKRFFKQRPSRDSLYEKHILAAPHNSSDLSFINVFKILTALKKSNAIESEGIFRVNGSTENIRTLWLGLNSISDSVPYNGSHHDLSGLLKLYFRETRFPLIPMELFAGPLPQTGEEVKEFIFSKLPDENIKILTATVDYLYQVTLKTSLNKMNPLSLGVCFAPSLIRPVNEQTSQVGISQIQAHCNFITTMIDNRMSIFSQKETLPDLSNTPELPPQPTHRNSVNQHDEYFIPPPPSFVLDQIKPEDEEDDENILEGALKNINPLYDEFINLLTDDSLGSQQKTIIIERMTDLFSSDGENFKNFLRDMGIDGIISLLEYILTLE